ncbi:vegetative incompatibility het-e-1 [Trichoderma arundinaceum]|uniref:Vegetative incompatibility het-e-1 n=1 Tax=Trichoderma arundinaceum TaxID=490622 RepID=A0A395NZ68_TRIAR|nr:vegetative incompatibility het-e-1 [Trichoderma arundinaceum]
MEGLGVATSIFSVVELSAKVASLCLQYSKDVKHAKDDILRLRGQISDLENASKTIQELLESPNSAKLKASQQLHVAIHSSQSQLQGLHDSLRPRTARQAMSRLGLRSLKWPFQSKDIDQIVQVLGQNTQTILLALQVDQTTLLLNIDQKIVLDRLPVALGASFDSRAEEQNPTCLSNTRVEFLDQVMDWAKDPHTEAIFWLNGMAGTGKSTISRTIARSLASTGHLGASFFFKRGEADRGSSTKLFTTIAAQLAAKKPAIAVYIKNAIDTDPMISDKGLKEQFERLILQPFSMVSLNTGKAEPLVIVIDALDECDLEDKVKLIIHLLGRAKSVGLKVFVTSRPELPIRLGFSIIKGKYRNLVLHEIPEPILEHDLSLFLEHELATFREIYNNSVPEDRQLEADWPGQRSIDALVTMANPLFIFAATVCRFIADRKGGKDPKARLRIILEYETKSQESKLDATYLPVLNQLLVGLSGRERNEFLDQFQNIVGSIVLLASPLSTSALAQLLDIPRHAIDATLDELHSVLSIPQQAESPVRLLHLSFRDFLMDPGKQGHSPFWIDASQSHARITDNCLRIMKDFLRQDICGLRQLGLEGSTVDSLKVDTTIPAAVKYACRNWVFHLQGAGNEVGDYGEIYSSVLVFAPRASLIRNHFESAIPDWIQLRPRMRKNWDQCVQILEGHGASVGSVAFSHDSSLVASASDDMTVRLWRADSGGCVQILEGHSASVKSVAFSDNTLIASASDDMTVRLWRIDSGECIQILEGHSASVKSIAFSHNSIIASASDDMTVRLWSADSGECVQILEGHGASVWSVAFSHDSLLVASASSDKTVRLWHADSGECVQILEGHSDWVGSVAFSHNSLIASASDDMAVRLWRANSGECMQTLEGHSDWVGSVAISHDSSLIASASDDKTVRLWRADSGKYQCVQILEGHGASVGSVAFSHDSSLVASASDDKTVRLWRADLDEFVQTLEDHGASVGSVTFSHDSSLIASASDDKTLRLWCADSGKCVKTLKGHGASVKSVTFSHNSTLMASTSDDKTARLWRVDSGECIQTLKSHSDWIWSVAFSHNSLLVALALSDKTVRLWRVDSGECVQILEGHSDWVWSVAFSHDSSLIASASSDKTVRLWHADSAYYRHRAIHYDGN